MALLSRDQILTADDLKTEEVPVIEWGGSVLVRALTGAERDDYEFAMLQARDKGRLGKASLRAGLVARCVVDEHGERLFPDADIQRLGMKSAAALDRLFEAASKLSRLSQQDQEELEGNLEQTDGEPSPSDSPSISAAPEPSSSETSTQAS